MFSRFCTQTVLCLIVITLIIPSGLLLYPQKAKASNDCLIRIGAMFGVKKALSKLTASRVPIEESTPVQTGVAGSFMQDCVIKPLVTQLVKAMLYNITVSTVNWINSGFQGNPGFVQDFRALMTDTADQVIGEFLEKEAGFLCSPFAFQVRVQLAQTYLPFRQRAACTLSDVVRNVEGFAENNNNVGWDRWIEVTTVPQNNAYGAFVIAQDEVSKRIVDAQFLKEKYLDWGDGFKDWESCETQAEADARFAEENNYNLPDAKGLGDPQCTKETPGKIVQNRLSKTLDMDLEQLAVADNLNAIYDALTNQFMKMVVNGTVGLLGGKKSPNEKQPTGAASWGSVDYSKALTNTNDPSLTAAIDTSLNQTTEELNPFFTEAEAIYPGDTEETNTEPVMIPPTPQIELSVMTAGTPIVTSANPLSYEINLLSNFASGGYTLKMTFLRNGSQYPISSIFAKPQEIFFGRADLYYNTRYIDSDTDANIKWSPISTSKTSKYVFKFKGEKRTDAPRGNYTIETVLTDSTGKVVDTELSDFVVQ